MGRHDDYDYLKLNKAKPEPAPKIERINPRAGLAMSAAMTAVMLGTVPAHMLGQHPNPRSRRGPDVPF